MTAIPARAREDGWVERLEPALPYPQMDSLAGLAVVAPSPSSRPALR